MLYPVIGNMNARGRLAVCLSNIRQVGLMHLMYTDVSDGVFCPAWDNDFNQWDASGDYKSEGLLSKAVGSVSAMDSAVFSCPEGRQSLYFDERYSPKFAGYGYNYLLSFASPKDYPPAIRYLPRSRIRKPAQVVLIADAGVLLSVEGGVQPGPTSFLMPTTSGTGGYADFRHSGQAVATYVDDHAAAQSTLTKCSSLQKEYQERFGYLSKDNSAYTPR